MAPVVNSLVTLLAGAATISQMVDAKPLVSPGRHAPPAVANLLSSARRHVHRAIASYYGWEHGLTKPAPLPAKRDSSLPAGWDYFGCVSESWNERLLQGFAFSSETLTTTLCLTQCQKLGYKFGATEYADECYCGNEFVGSGGGLTSDSTCSMPCAGGGSEECGSSWYLSLYQFNASWACPATSTAPTTPTTGASNSTTTTLPDTGSSTNTSTSITPGTGGTTNATSPGTTSPGNGTVLLPVSGSGSGTNNTSDDTTTTATGTAITATTAKTATTAALPGVTTTPAVAANTTQWYALGCAVDSETRVISDYVQQVMMDLTIDDCLSICENLGFKFAGVEFGEQCFCGSKLPATVQYAEDNCDMPCTGNSSETCGGHYALDLYELIAGNVTDCTDTNVTTSTTQIGQGLGAIPTASVGVSIGTDGLSLGVSIGTAVPTTNVTKNVTVTSAGVTTVVSATSHVATTSLVTTSVTTTSEAAASSVTTTSAATTSASVTTSEASASASAVSPSNGNAPSSSSSHAVWAHHMVGNTYPYSQSDWSRDISAAQAAGIDGFALNIGVESWQLDRVHDAYAAASGTGFKLFLSLDMTSLGCNSQSDANNLVSIVQTHATDSSQAMHNGKPLVSTFAGSDCNFGMGSTSGWQSMFVDVLKSQYSIDIFFVPSIFSDISTFSSNTWMDGELNWNSAWPMGDNDISTQTDTDYISALGGREYMAAVSPFFFTHFSPQTWNKNWIYKSDDWLYCTRWEQIIAMRDQTSMTEILTWNDFGESSYIGAIDGALPAGSDAWVDGFDHQGLNHLTKYYATAFKTGAYPSIDQDVLVMWSRPHPHDATASSDGTGRPTGWDWTTDFLWAVVLSTGDATVTLTSGSNTENFSVKAGLTKLKIANSPGGMSGQITRNGAVVASYNGAGFTYTDSPSTYNYNYFVGSSS